MAEAEMWARQGQHGRALRGRKTLKEKRVWRCSFAESPPGVKFNAGKKVLKATKQFRVPHRRVEQKRAALR